MPAPELARRVRARDDPLTSVELTTRCVARARRVNPLLNAIVAERFDAALADAAAADAALARGGDGGGGAAAALAPLWGVPCVVKECFELPGMPFTAGIRARAAVVGAEWCPAVARAREAGLIVLGVANVSEACMFHEVGPGWCRCVGLARAWAPRRPSSSPHRHLISSLTSLRSATG